MLVCPRLIRLDQASGFAPHWHSGHAQSHFGHTPETGLTGSGGFSRRVAQNGGAPISAVAESLFDSCSSFLFGGLAQRRMRSLTHLLTVPPFLRQCSRAAAWALSVTSIFLDTTARG